ncbi:MAG TPA: alpha/beta fold hydrolase [Noviherbaspirillum sp.]|nr:alpha/beta fold hydrolase [Noviherbaspirillum sp.]
MIAWLTRLLLILQAAIATALYLLFTRTLGIQNVLLAAAMAIAAVPAVRILIIANNFMLAHRFRSPLPEHCKLDWRGRLALFLGEVRASLTASSWHLPFKRFHKRPIAGTRELPVLLVHGYGCNSGYWAPFSVALSRAGITHHALDMEPVFGSIDGYAAHIHAAVEELCRDSGQERIVIVAHSMGGLAVRAYLRAHGSTRVAKVITLGTPHRGTALARLGAGINSQEMLWAVREQEGLCSKWLRELAASETEQTYRLFVSIYSHHDNIVSPQTSSHLPGARNIALHGIGHVALAPTPRVMELVIGEIKTLAADEQRDPSRPGTLRDKVHAAG